MTPLRYPTFDEVRTLELAARRARNRELSRLARSVLAYLRQRLRPGPSAKAGLGYETLRGW
jgi:hypothetical protein